MNTVETVAGGPSLSPLVQGYWRLADWNIDAQARLRFIEQHLELGISTVDHADIYGDYRCEALFGEALALQPGLRARLQLISKCGIMLRSQKFPERGTKHYDTSAGHITSSVENSLRRLGTDHLDVLLLHRPDPLMDADEVAAAFASLRSAGKVRHFGVSNFTPSQFELLQARLDVPLVTNQVELNPLRTGALLDGTLDQLQCLAVRPMAWSPLAGGQVFSGTDAHSKRLRAALGALSAETGERPDTLLFAWVLRHPSRPLPIVGSGNIERVRAAARSLEVKMDREAWFRILEAGSGREVP